MSRRPNPEDNAASKTTALLVFANAVKDYRVQQAAVVLRQTVRWGEPTKGRLMPADRALRMVRFADRGLSGHTIAGLIKSGIDLPERVLFMSEAQIRVLPGVGKKGVSELMAYRARFMVA